MSDCQQLANPPNLFVSSGHHLPSQSPHFLLHFQHPYTPVSYFQHLDDLCIVQHSLVSFCLILPNPPPSFGHCTDTTCDQILMGLCPFQVNG